MAEPDQVFCKFCGEKIDADCVVCPHCGKQVKDLKSEQTQPQIVINNANNNSNTNVNAGIAPEFRMVISGFPFGSVFSWAILVHISSMKERLEWEASICARRVFSA